MVKSNKMIPEEIIVYISDLENRKDSLNKKARLKLAHLKVLCTSGKMTNKIQQEYKALVELAKEPKELSIEDLTYDGDIEDLLSDPSLSDTLPFLMGKLIKVLNEEEPDSNPPIIDRIMKTATNNHLDGEKLYFGGNLEKWFTIIKDNRQAKLTYTSLVIAGDFGPVEHVDKMIETYETVKEENKKEEEMKNDNVNEENKMDEEAETVKEENKKEEEEMKNEETKESSSEDSSKRDNSFTDNLLSAGKYAIAGVAIVAAIYGISKFVEEKSSTDIEIPDSIF